ncbi:polar amino acid transport system substrate-binding protein [Paucimonas lemoignei]|uniref:Polar amino acid transport system substrate-binding protein n=1 Tax=Paucimonas lemoignei TaxID=29443 RepID=A0A4R3HQ34_PAULE|nr:transporter substrate-binding domain-containing protein [Paucimonas lemoignei]TCS32731.1 polar amino acid transport system substrate-binding protein [Paucimonas lemoignei]
MKLSSHLPSSAMPLPAGAAALVMAAATAVTGLGMALPATAADTLAQARQRGELRIGMAYVAPEYAAGAKFRTPEGIEHALAQDLAQRLQVKAVPLQQTADKHRASPAKARKADLQLLVAPAGASSARADVAAVPTGYVAAPMAIMRTDTTIKSWEQLKGRSVCVTQSGRYAGLAARYGATEKSYKAAADALLALRTGACDATIHDAALLEELLKLPEWKKFSARLTPLGGAPLVIILPKDDDKARAWATQVTQDWQARGYLQQQLRLMARNIAFEVYLDQDVPDCH